MRFLRRESRSIVSGLVLALLAFLLITVVVPAVAQVSFPTNASRDTVKTESTDSAVLLEQGKTRYQVGQFSEAVPLWQQAAQIYQKEGNLLNQALSFSYLSLAYQQLGNWSAAEQAIVTSLDILQTQPDANPAKTAVLAQALNTQAQLHLALGRPQMALETWQQAEQTYAQLRDFSGVLGSQINQAQAMQTLGFYRRAKTVLEQAHAQLMTQPSSDLKAIGLRNLGDLWRVFGDLEQSQTTLQESLAVSTQLNSPVQKSETLFALGNTKRALSDIPAAIRFYQQASELAPTTIGRLQAQANQLSLLLSQDQWNEATALLQNVDAAWPQITPSRTSIYIQVNIVSSLLQTWEQWPAAQRPSLASLSQRLATAIQQARTLKDARSESYALGKLGALYAQNQQWQSAKTVTQQALVIAQIINATDISYRWHWQLGRVAAQQKDRKAAISAYTNAIEQLQSLQGDLVASSLDVQFSFQEAVEPVYREFVSLLTEPAQPSQADLKQAREVIEALQLAELENFLRSACLDIRPSQIDQVDPTAAIFYPIILKDRLSVVLSLPKQPLKLYTVPLSQQAVETEVDRLLESLNPIFSRQEQLQRSRQLYDQLIRPAESDLAQSEIKTLIFVPDGVLRNLPMAVLHDGQQYLVERYNLAIAPGLQLLEPKPLDAVERLPVLVGGLSVAREKFPELPSVVKELDEIANRVKTQVLLNDQFTLDNLQRRIERTDYPLVHLATHGQFGSSLQDTFLLSWNKRISVDELRNLLQLRSRVASRPIELLVLSACETAEGDRRASLGLAGLSVRSGARSTLATLWSVNDDSTAALMTDFYRYLIQDDLSKSEALRKAQIDLIKDPKYNHPFFWAAFILVGNWL